MSAAERATSSLEAAALEQVAQGPAEQCGMWWRDDEPGAPEVQCPEVADYVVRTWCVAREHVLRTPVCLEHVDGLVERVEAGARCARHRTRVTLVSVTPLGG